MAGFHSLVSFFHKSMYPENWGGFTSENCPFVTRLHPVKGAILMFSTHDDLMTKRHLCKKDYAMFLHVTSVPMQIMTPQFFHHYEVDNFSYFFFVAS